MSEPTYSGSPRPPLRQLAGEGQLAGDDDGTVGPALRGAEATGAGAPHTGDLVIDAALTHLAEVGDDDPDALVLAGGQLESALRARLSDLGG